MEKKNRKKVKKQGKDNIKKEDEERERWREIMNMCPYTDGIK